MLFREGLARLLHDENFDVVASVGDADRLVVETLRQRPDVAIVDVRMPSTHTQEGLDAAVRIRAQAPQTGVLILSQFVEAHHALSLLASSTAGVGYLLKDRVVDVTSFVESVRRVASGGTVFDPEVVDQLLHPRVTATPLDALTSRERDVLALMAQGASNTAIASHLCISGKTVETHIRSIFTHLNLNPRNRPTPTRHRRPDLPSPPSIGDPASSHLRTPPSGTPAGRPETERRIACGSAADGMTSVPEVGVSAASRAAP